MVADELIEEIRAQADITAIVGEFVSLKRSGRTYRGPCPLHGGEGPNFSVDPRRGIFKCFVCGEGGDVFAFPMKHLGLDFIEAVKFVAERCGITVPERDRSGQEEDPHREVREAVAFAAEWFRKQLWEEREGESARRYLTVDRGLPEETARKFGFGYAPDSWRALREAAAVHEMDDELLIRAGLVKTSERAKEPYDLFRGRLMIPIYDLRDRPIGFGGRTLTGGSDAPKYINSPDNPIFHKGEIVYGLNWSRHAIRRQEVALVVEGYMDLVALMAAGVENVVAPLGTGLTEEQAKLIARYAERALLLYDSDRAGLVATFKTADELLRVGVHPSVATLPRGEDPDSIIRSEGPEELANYIDSARDVLDRKIEILEQRGYLDSIEGRRRAVDGLLLTVRAARDAALKDIYLDRVAGVTGVRRSTLERELGAGRVAGRRRRKPTPSATPEPTPGRALGMGAERKLLMLLLRDPSLMTRVAELLGPDNFRTPEYRSIFNALLRAAESGGNGAGEQDVEPLAWADDLPVQLYERVKELAADPEELTNPEVVLEDAIARLRAWPLEKRLNDLTNEVLVEGSDADSEKLAEIMRIRRELQDLGHIAPGRGFFRSD